MKHFFLKRWIDSFRGSGEAAVTVPSMDGALKPNRLLDQADILWNGEGITPSNLVSDGIRIVFNCGTDILEITTTSTDPKVKKLLSIDESIASLALHSSGNMAIGLSAGGVKIIRPDGEEIVVGQSEQNLLNCPTAMAFEDDETLIVANGSATNRVSDWCRDLMEKNRSGSIWRFKLNIGSAQCIASDLGFPAGIALTDDGKIIVSESWQHRLICVAPDKPLQVLSGDLPGYPGSIIRGANGGYWLSIFAPRRQLIEFVLREETYRKQMLATIDQKYWIAPALKSGVSYFEPIQSGSVRHLGMVKPWAPMNSYGLLIQLDNEFNTRASFHSRADAQRHGITSAAEHGERVFMTCAALNQVLVLDPLQREK